MFGGVCFKVSSGFIGNSSFRKRRREANSVRLCFLVLSVLLAYLATAIEFRAADGDLDPTFGFGGKRMYTIAAGERDFATTVAIQADGKAVIGGELGDFTSDFNQTVLTRLNRDGSPDPAFGNAGVIISGSQIHIPKLVIQPDGKILAAAATSIFGTNWDFSVTRYNPDGSLDQTFGNGGVATNGSGHAQWIVLQPDGRIVLVGFIPLFRNGSDYLVARFNADGTVDSSFGTGGRVQTSFTSGRNSSDVARAGAIQADGKIVLTGSSGGFSPAMIRYNPDGSVDTSFGLDGTVFTPNFGGTANRILIQPDGKIVVSGGPFVVGRYNPNGTTDQTFGSGGRVSGGFGPGNGSAHDMIIQNDGRIIVAGSVCFTGTGDCAFLLGRYAPDGTFDTSFGSNGFVITEFTGALDEANAVALQPKAKLLAVGYAAEPGASNVDFAAARYLAHEINGSR
jgi:uncharacterized delta-60 repeat protein